MGLRFKNQKYGECFFVTTSFADHQPLGNFAGVYEILATAVNFQLKETNSKLIAYVFMPSHIHLVLVIKGFLLADFMRDFKKYTSQKTLREYSISYKIWQDRYDRQVIWSEKILRAKIEYIHNNPVKAGLVEASHNWHWSSADDYIKRTNGPLEIWKEWI
jgi:REP element-mobilizing transposase RayT